MAVLEIRTYPDEVLREEARPVEAVDSDVSRLMDDMVETMHARSGLGLAAPQVGVLKRVIVVHVQMEDESHPLVTLANPEIVESSGDVEFEEGCLSLPGFLTLVHRAERVRVKGLDHEGREVEIDAGGLLAVALQHELDHLNGRLIIDSASSIKRSFYRKRAKKLAAREQ